MPDELHYQSEIVKAVNHSGGYALKISHRYLAGVPDLLLKPKEWTHPQFWEVKRDDLPVPFRPLRIKATPLQRKTLRDMKSAGLQVGILVVLTSTGRSVTLALTRDPDQQHFGSLDGCQYIRRLAEPWDEAIKALNALVPVTTKTNSPCTW
jgi:hypothetical protein